MVVNAKFCFALIVFTILTSENVIAKIRQYYGDEDDGYGRYEEKRGYAVGNKPLITMGKDANIKDFPYVVFMTGINEEGEGNEEISEEGGDNLWGCTGLILTSTVILTNAKCLTPDIYDITMNRTLSFTNAYIKAGVTNRDDPRAKKIFFTKGIVHTNYSVNHNKHMQYNVALVKLNKPLCKSKTIQPLKFATEADFEQANKIGTVLGWGWTKAIAGSISNTLQQIKLKKVPDDECDILTDNFMGDDMFCTMNLNNTFEGGLCKGDFGGPFIVNNKVYAIGATWVSGCTSANYFVNVADPEVKSWIKKTCLKLHYETSRKRRPNRPNRRPLNK